MKIITVKGASIRPPEDYGREFLPGTEVHLNEGGQFHREDGPAIIYPNGYEEWWLNGLRHRVGGPACTGEDGYNQEWWVNGIIHREDGPAKVSGDEEEYWVNGQLHRLDGPAVYNNYYGDEWWIHGQRIFNSKEGLDCKDTPDPNIQEFVIKHWPHLIGQLENLDPLLEFKYQHELEISRVDL
jgi:hypothetical protein